MLVFLFLLFSASRTVFAQSVQSIEFATPGEIDERGEIPIELISANIKGEKYRVRPLVNEGTIYIETVPGSWVPGQVSWTQLPTMKNKFKLKLADNGSYSVWLTLQFQEIKSGTVLTSMPVEIYWKEQKNLYIQKINDSVSESTVVLNQETTSAETSVVSQTYNASGLSNFLPTVFITGCALSLFGIYLDFKSSLSV
ncbi:hypothetical protein GYA27_03255 [candidate division WWE3 bacterium]|uniref:Uncharacterized protein n=1 Tax=candidate division WWE3 bacterium TaxID=2053526 RepID=A0A7X9DKI2_UNCKA|nr:hypothetical protein [candidate division WWE3 bacterium]